MSDLAPKFFAHGICCQTCLIVLALKPGEDQEAFLRNRLGLNAIEEHAIQIALWNLL